jgi:hypothetical protein
MTRSFTIDTNCHTWMRVTPAQNNVAASATVQNYVLVCWAADADISADYVGVYVSQFATTGPRARFVKKVSGVTTEIGTTATYPLTPSNISFALIQKTGSNYYGWVANEAGAWMYLGTTTYAGTTLDNTGFAFFDDGGTPGSRVTYVDFFRYGATTLNPLP